MMPSESIRSNLVWPSESMIPRTFFSIFFALYFCRASVGIALSVLLRARQKTNFGGTQVCQQTECPRPADRSMAGSRVHRLSTDLKAALKQVNKSHINPVQYR